MSADLVKQIAGINRKAKVVELSRQLVRNKNNLIEISTLRYIPIKIFHLRLPGYWKYNFN